MWGGGGHFLHGAGPSKDASLAECARLSAHSSEDTSSLGADLYCITRRYALN